MITVLVSLFFGVAAGMFLSAVLTAAKYHDLTIENRVLTNKLVEIYKLKDHQNED